MMMHCICDVTNNINKFIQSPEKKWVSDCLARNKYPNPWQAVSEYDCVTRNQFDLLIKSMSVIERECFLCVEVISMFP